MHIHESANARGGRIQAVGAPWVTRAVLDILRAAGFHVGWVQVIAEWLEQDRHVEAA